MIDTRPSPRRGQGERWGTRRAALALLALPATASLPVPLAAQLPAQSPAQPPQLLRAFRANSALFLGPSLGESVLFVADDGVHGYELWRSDGTPAGTTLVADIRRGPGSAFWSRDPVAPWLGGFDGVRLGACVLFVVDDGSAPQSLYTSDGTASGTFKLRDLEFGGNASSGFQGYRLEGVVLGDRLVFPAVHGGVWKLWSSDGSAANTQPYATTPSIAVSLPPRLVRHRDRAYFSAPDGLWETDGTSAGTRRISQQGRQVELAFAGDTLVFGDSNRGIGELWSWNAGVTTRLLTGFRFPPRRHRAHGALVFFAGWTDAHGEEPWITDGTAAGTRMLADLAPGSPGVRPLAPVSTPGGIVFGTDEDDGSVARHRVFCTDGTSAGTRQLVDCTAGFTRLLPQPAALGSRFVYFGCMNGGTAAIWRSDGTPAGTQRWLAAPAFVAGLTWLRDRAVFASLSELWAVAPGAVAEPFGRGCGALGAAPRLFAEDPVLGASVNLRVAGGAALGAGVLLADPGPLRFTQLAGCELHFGSSAVALQWLALDAAGAWQSAPILVPNVPALTGLSLVLQALLVPGGSPLGIDVTPGVVWVVGV